MQALYRQYRPKRFSDVIGQDHIIKTLKNQIARQAVAHAYIFVGTRGVGKTSVARLFATASNCLQPRDGELCGDCEHCHLIEQGKFPDIIEIDAASHTGVDNVRTAIVEAVRFAPMQGIKKVFIIDEVHMLSTSAFNALLKTLEEPPEHALFILATTEFRKVPDTVASRCQRFFFQNIPQTLIEKTLADITEKEKRQISEEALHAIARVANGSLRDAERTLEQVFGTTDGRIAIEHVQQVIPVPSTDVVFSLLQTVIQGDASALEEILVNATSQGISMHLLREELIELTRVILLALHGTKNGLGIWTEHKEWTQVIQGTHKQLLLRILRALIDPSLRFVDIGVSHLGLQIALLELMETKESHDDNHVPTSPATSHQIQKKNEDTNTHEAVQVNNTQTAKVDTKTAKEQESPATVHTRYSLEEIQNKWGRCCDAVAKQSVSLPLVLRAARPSSYDGKTLEVTFERAFHFETMSDMKNLQLLTKCVQDILQQEILIKPKFEQKIEDKQISDVAAAFGGVVIDDALNA